MEVRVDIELALCKQMKIKATPRLSSLSKQLYRVTLIFEQIYSVFKFIEGLRELSSKSISNDLQI
jgi:hypothetical protein